MSPTPTAPRNIILTIANTWTTSTAGSPTRSTLRQKINLSHVTIRRTFALIRQRWTIFPFKMLLLLLLHTLWQLLVLTLEFRHGLRTRAGPSVYHLFGIPQLHFSLIEHEQFRARNFQYKCCYGDELFCFQRDEIFFLLTCLQFLPEPAGNFFHRFTNSTQALHISPCRGVDSWKHSRKSSSYFLLSVNLELFVKKNANQELR